MGNHWPHIGGRHDTATRYCLSDVVASDVQVFDAATRTYWRAGKKYGQSLTPDRVVDGLAVFFSDGRRMREEVISAALWQLYQLKAWAERQTRCETRFVGWLSPRLRLHPAEKFNKNAGNFCFVQVCVRGVVGADHLRRRAGLAGHVARRRGPREADRFWADDQSARVRPAASCRHLSRSTLVLTMVFVASQPGEQPAVRRQAADRAPSPAAEGDQDAAPAPRPRSN